MGLAFQNLGNDLEMPGPKPRRTQAVIEAVQNGDLPESARGDVVGVFLLGLDDRQDLPAHPIDGGLINGLSSNKDNQARVQAILELAEQSGKVTIAECVDDAGSLAQLWQYGVDFIQGNFVQEPSKDLEYDFEGEIA